MAHLFDTFKLRSVVLRNRIGCSPMCQYSCEELDGLANDHHVVNAGSFASGGCGIVFVEATAVEARIWSDAHIAPLARVAKVIKGYGAVPGIQIAHAGRKASTYRPWSAKPDSSAQVPENEGGWEPIGPSAIAHSSQFPMPRVMTMDDIKAVEQSFVDAAIRARKAGFEFLELHGGHGYLINNFLSPISNERTDAYGGSFENRTRLLLDIVKRIRVNDVWPDNLPLSVRLSVTDWAKGAWDTPDSIELAKILKTLGVDLINCSSGYNVPASFTPYSGYQVPFAEAIRSQAQVATAAVGLIREPSHANEIIANGRADLVLLAREMLRDPHWPIHAAEALLFPTESLVIPQYARAHGTVYPPKLQR